MSSDLVALLYLVAGVLFILALRGLSSPETSRRGNYLGMAGMAIAVLTTLAVAAPDAASDLGDDYWWHRGRRRHRRGDRAAHPHDGDAGAGRGVPFAGRPGGGAGGGGRLLRAGSLRHRRARRDPHAKPGRDVARHGHRRHHLHRLDHRLPQAFRPHVGQADHPAGAPSPEYGPRARAGRLHRHVLPRPVAGVFLGDRGSVLPARHPDHRAHRRRRHAGGDLDAELLFGVGGGRHRLHAWQFGADHHRRAGRLVGRDPLLHHVQGDEPLLHQRDPRRLRRRGCRPRRGRRAEAGQARLGRGRRLSDEECQQGDHRARLRHGGGAGAARLARDGRRAEEGRASRSNMRSIRWRAACRVT